MQTILTLAPGGAAVSAASLGALLVIVLLFSLVAHALDARS